MLQEVTSEEREIQESKPTAIKNNTTIEPTLNSSDHQLLRQTAESANSLSEQFQLLQITDNNSPKESLIASSTATTTFSISNLPANLNEDKATSLSFGDTIRQPDAVLS